MKNIKFVLAFLLVGFSLLWWVSDQTVWSGLDGIFGWRPVLMQFTGVLAIGVMSVAIVLASRPAFLEPYLGGLDKMYRLHKWLGISALVLSVTHWLIAKGPKWMVGWGWLVRPARHKRPELPPDTIQAVFASLRGLAEDIGEWAFYAAAALLVLALVKRFPYRYFYKTHRLLAIAFVALVLHAVVLLQFDYWGSVLGIVIGALMAAGTAAALLVLTRRVALSRQVVGEVAAIVHYEALGVVRIDIALKGRWRGHEAGQFAFLTLHEGEGPHPFTITSAWAGDGRIQFVVKALGDYTRTLASRTKVGAVAKIEGPYGQFTFQGEQPRQIWVGGGIGITPFISRMKALAHAPDGKSIDLFHSTADYDETAISLLKQYAQAAGVRLHVLWDQRDGRLDAERICQVVKGWQEADVWFCGPSAFGDSLQQAMAARGMPGSRFHREIFEMR